MLGLTEELLRLSLVKFGVPTPEPGTSEADLRQLYRDAMEVKLEADDPIAGYEEREHEAWKAALQEQP